MTNENDWVFDPFMGVGSTAIAALIHNRKAIGSEIMSEYISIARERIEKAEKGQLQIRPMDRPVFNPSEPTKNLPPKTVNFTSAKTIQPQLLETKTKYSTKRKKE